MVFLYFEKKRNKFSLKVLGKNVHVFASSKVLKNDNTLTLEQREKTSKKRERRRKRHAVEKYASSAVETRRPSAERETSPSIVGGESHLSRADCGCDLERDRGVWVDVFFDVFVVVFFERDW